MNCQVVMELMQRELDHDLTDSERRAMLVHLENCPECASLFDRLQLLSDELEALPAVVPPFSIVDSILPRLGAPVDYRHEQSAGREAAAVFPQSPPNRIFSWKIVGGAVAAAVILGIALTNNSGMFMHSSADGPSQAANSKITAGANPAASAGSAASASPAAAVTGQPASASPSSEPAPALGVTQQTSQPAEADTKGKAPAESGSPAAGSSPAKEPEASTFKAAGSAPASQSPHPAASSSSTGKATASAASSAPAAAKPSPGQVVEPQKVGGDNVVTYQPPAAIIPMSPGGAAASSEPSANALPPQAGLIAVPNDPHRLDSESGKYTAVVDQSRVVVHNSSTGAAVFTSSTQAEPTDTIRLVSWQGDTQLHYDIISGGSVRSYTIDMALNKEIK